MPKETWSAINSPKLRLIRDATRRLGIGSGKIISTETIPVPPPLAQTKDAWNDRIIPLELGAFTTEIKEWRRRYKDLIHYNREDKNPEMEEATRKRYENDHGVRVSWAKEMQVPSLEVLAERLSTRNMTAWEAHLLGVTCLYGVRPVPQENDTLFDWYSIAFIKKAHFLSRWNPLHPYGVSVELERLFEKYGLKGLEEKQSEQRRNLNTFFHNEGRKEFTAPHYDKQIQEWAGKYVEEIMNYQKRKYEERVRKGAVDIGQENWELWKREAQDLQRRFEGEHKEHVRVVMLERKQTNAYFKYMFEQAGNASSYFLYRNLGLPALRNPRDSKTIKEKNLDELKGFEILKEAYNRAGDDPSDLKNYKGFHAYVNMMENVNKWMKLRNEFGEKVESGPKVRKRAYQILETAFIEWKNKDNPLPSIDKPLYEPDTYDDSYLNTIPR